MKQFPRCAPATLGLLLAAAIAGAAYGLEQLLPLPVSAVALAVLLGVVVALRVTPSLIDRGRRFAAKQVLQLGIILLGARLSLGEIAQLGAKAVLLVAGSIILAATVATVLAHALGLSRELGTLLGVGSAICGNTAIMASAPVLRAGSRDVGLAVGTITLCGTIALLVYPWIGLAIGLDDTTFGVWIGLAVQDTSQVVATAEAYSPEARDTATVVKLVRNTALALVLPLLAWWWQRRGRGSGSADARPSMRTAFPVFILGFLAMSGLRSAGLLSPEAGEVLGTVASGAILVAVAGLGLGIDLRTLGRTDLRAVAVGGVTAAVLGVAALGAAMLLTAAPDGVS